MWTLGVQPLPRAIAVAPEDRAARHLDRRGVTSAFTGMSLRYGLSVFPEVARELSRLRRRAAQIPDETLRRLALESLRKRGNMEGAALFAAFAPRAQRTQTVRALVAFQAAYNYLDLLTEQPSELPVENGRALHRALIAALDPGMAEEDHYSHHPQREDGGYLLELVELVRASLARLPSAAATRDAARAAAARIVEFQALNLGECQGGHEGLERWARTQAPASSDLRWWEAAAAAGSSLGVHAMIALAAEPDLERRRVGEVEAAYFPWLGALHSLLDSLIDVGEDRRERQRNLLGYYRSGEEAAARLGSLAGRARAEAAALGQVHRHEALLAAMEGYYLTEPCARSDAAASLRQSIAVSSDRLLGRSLPLFRAARVLSALARERR